MTGEGELRNIRIDIRRNADGALSSQVWKDHAWYVYWWAEGNASCDCNRNAFFHQPNVEYPEPGPCGYRRFAVRIIDADSGEVLYDEIGH